jgi:ATP-dependent protease ClpP protease subunit
VLDLNKLQNLADTARAKAQQNTRKRDGRSWYRIENAANGLTEVYLYDFIGEWGVTASDFVGELRNAKAGAVDLHINCEGGEVFDGLAIYAAIQQHKGHVAAYVDGLAASSASFIAQAADEIVMAPRSRMMIHDAHGLAIGNARDMQAMAALLDDLSDNIAEIYAARSGKSVAYWRTAMHGQDGSDGTWYDAEAAVAAGLADRVAAGRTTPEDSAAIPAAASTTFAWDPSKFISEMKETIGA